MPSVAGKPEANRCPACGYALTGLPSRVCPECGVAITPPLLARAARRAAWRRRIIVLAVMAFAIYAPFSWLVWIDYPWSDYRWLWLRMWPILPGLPTTILLRWTGLRLPEPVEMLCMALLTAAALGLLTWLGLRGRWWLIVLAIVALALSCFNAFVAYQMYLL